MKTDLWVPAGKRLKKMFGTQLLSNATAQSHPLNRYKGTLCQDIQIRKYVPILGSTYSAKSSAFVGNVCV